MKKVLLITWTIALMLFCNTYLKASEIDLTFSGFHHHFNNAIDVTWNGTNPICYAGQQGNQQTCEYLKFYSFDTNYTQNQGNGYIIKIPFSDMLSTQTQEGTIKPVAYDMSFFIISLEGSWYSCAYDSGTIICPLENNKTYKQIAIQGKANYDILDNFWTWHINDYSSIWITGQSTINNAINSQTQQQQQQYQEATNGTWTPNNNVNTNQNGANETLEYGQQEQQLMDEIEINESSLDNVLSSININTQASAFIWDIATGIRNMNPKMILLFTSILGLGIIKMVLNR